MADQLNIDVGNRLTTGSRKIKFLIHGPLPEDSKFPEGFRDFDICHHFLQTSDEIQSRLRKPDSKGKAKVTSTYTHTIRKMVSGKVIETKRSLDNREYEALVIQESSNHLPVHKTRRCFLFNSQYFQLDTYSDDCHERCQGLMLLETYTTMSVTDLKQRLPDFLDIGSEVTGDPAFSMFNLSLKEKWENNQNFCHSMKDSNSDLDSNKTIQDAMERLDLNKSSY